MPRQFNPAIVRTPEVLVKEVNDLADELDANTELLRAMLAGYYKAEEAEANSHHDEEQ